ncbi:unnamed protein product, partial [Didymodactylos carnosus]
TDDGWNILDCTAILLYLIGFIARFIVIEQAFIVSKICMALDLFLWHVRMLRLFAIRRLGRLGPKLLMIYYSMKDLVFFIYFILIFLFGYSISSYALITTREQVTWIANANGAPARNYTLTNDGTGLWYWEILRNVFDWGMWKVYGQVNLFGIQEADNTTLTGAINDAYGVTTFLLTIAFVGIANVILLNVLVALFNDTLRKVGDRAEDAWAFHHFLLVNEYTKKSVFVPPLSVIDYIFQLYRLIDRCIKNKETDNTYGSIKKTIELDSHLSNRVVFNFKDQIKLDGFLTELSIHFCTPPIIEKPQIKLYIMSPTPDPCAFSIVKWPDSNGQNYYEIPPTTIKKMSGIQKFRIDANMRLLSGQFLAIGFQRGSGSPYSIDRDEYSVNLNHFLNISQSGKQSNKPIVFTNYPNKGAAFSFSISQTIGIVINKFQEHGNILREKIIAETYWKKLINEIIIEEKQENVLSKMMYNDDYNAQNTRIERSITTAAIQLDTERSNILPAASFNEDETIV